MEEQLEFGKGDQDSGIIEGYQAPFSEEIEFFLSKGVPNWPSQDIIEYIAEYGDLLCQRGKMGLRAEPETGR